MLMPDYALLVAMTYFCSKEMNDLK